MQAARHPAERQSAKPATLRPGYLAALAAVLALALGGFAWYELSTSRQVALKNLERSSISLVEAVARAGENTMRADAEIDRLALDHMLASARSLDHLEAYHPLSDSLLAMTADENDFYQIDVFNANGYPLHSSRPGAMDSYELDWWWAELAAVYEGLETEYISPLEAEHSYAVAVERRLGGAILVRFSSDRLLALRRASGVGRLITAIGENEGVVYMALQDSLGIAAASRDIGQISRIDADPFLEKVLATGSGASRTVAYGDREVFETALPFAPAGIPLGLLRVGLSIEALQAEERRDKVQLVLVTGLLVLLGAVGAGVVTIRQNYALLDEAYARVQTYSSGILAQMSDAVLATDVAGRIQVFNLSAEKLFGVKAADAVGLPYHQVLGRRLEPIERSLAAGSEIHGQELDYPVATGQRLLTLSTSLVRNNRQQVETLVVVAQDLTEKKALEADLQRRQRLASMGALASGVAHEVRNPLNAISVIAQRLGREFVPRQDEAEYRSLIGVVRDEVGRVDRIVRDFLNLARPPALDLRRVDLEQVLEKAADAVEPRARAKGLVLQRQYQPVGPLQLDPDQFTQVVQNLVGNAVEATETGRISIATQSAGNEAQILIEDTGAGIDEGDLEKIFDLYFTTKAEGTGLGLSLVHRIVSQHGGHIAVHSQLGRGTRGKI